MCVNVAYDMKGVIGRFSVSFVSITAVKLSTNNCWPKEKQPLVEKLTVVSRIIRKLRASNGMPIFRQATEPAFRLL